ncbi:MAG: hypothetical protein ACRDQZ_25160 [Mycobacteriales bacterium]
MFTIGVCILAAQNKPAPKRHLSATTTATPEREAAAADLNYINHRRALRFALVSRVLSPEEMAEVAREGKWLFMPDVDGAFFEADVVNEFHAALLQHFKLQAAAKCGQEK